jgi:hypothetical protein
LSAAAVSGKSSSSALIEGRDASAAVPAAVSAAFFVAAAGGGSVGVKASAALEPVVASGTSLSLSVSKCLPLMTRSIVHCSHPLPKGEHVDANEGSAFAGSAAEVRTAWVT